MPVSVIVMTAYLTARTSEEWCWKFLMKKSVLGDEQKQEEECYAATWCYPRHKALQYVSKCGKE
jgi:hypothetical protein